MGKILADDEREHLKSLHKKERDKRVCDRIKAIVLFDEGWTYPEIAHALLLSDEGVRNHIEEYQQSKKLLPENGGSSTKLKTEQLSKLLLHLEKHTYLFAKDILPYIEIEFGVQYTIPGITSLLKRDDFSYKKPSLVPGKANREQQEGWIRQYEILKQQMTHDEAICFIDGVHPTHNPQLKLRLDSKRCS
jgi:transposase